MARLNTQSRYLERDGDCLDGEHRREGTMIVSPCELIEASAFASMPDEPATEDLRERMEAERASDEQGPQSIHDAAILVKQVLPDYGVILQCLDTASVNNLVGQEQEPQRIYFLYISHRTRGSLPPIIKQQSCFKGDSWQSVIDQAEAAITAWRAA